MPDSFIYDSLVIVRNSARRYEVDFINPEASGAPEIGLKFLGECGAVNGIIRQLNIKRHLIFVAFTVYYYLAF